MYQYETFGSALDKWMSGQIANISDLSDEHKELFNDVCRFIVSRSPRRSAHWPSIPTAEENGLNPFQ